MKKSIALITVISISFFSFVSSGLPKTKKEQIVALETIIAELTTHYGLSEYKAQALGVDYAGLKKKYRNLINSATTLEEYHGLHPKVKRPVLPPEEFRQLLIGLGAEFEDGHLNIRRNRQQGSTLGLETAAFGNKLIITGFNNDFLIARGLSEALQVGDEIIAVNGRPVGEIAKENFLYAQRATYRSQMDFALETIANVPHAVLREKKEGEPVELTVSRPAQPLGKNPKLIKAKLHWFTADIDSMGFYVKPGTSATVKDGQGPETYVFGHKGVTDSYFSEGLKNLNLPLGSVIDIGQLINAQITPKSRSSDAQGFNNDSGLPVKAVTRLRAYLVNFHGRRIGVIRIPNYSPNGEMPEVMNEVQWLQHAIQYFENQADGLIFDQVGNNGGYIKYGSEVTRLFAHEELKGTTINIKLNETLLRNFGDRGKEEGGPRLPPSYPMNPYENNWAVEKLDDLQMEILREKYKNGEDWSGPIPYNGVAPGIKAETPGAILGAGLPTFSKPLLIINDSRSASCGDFVPGILQANKRALVIGSTSMGLGAPVYRSIESMPGSEMSLRCPFGLCRLSNNQPLENVGVPVDFYRPPNITDLKGGFQSFSYDVLATMASILDGVPMELIQTYLDKNNETSDLFTGQIPESLKKSDPILAILKHKDEVENRLRRMLNLPQYADIETQNTIKGILAAMHPAPADSAPAVVEAESINRCVQALR